MPVLDDFNRADGTVQAGAGATLWTSSTLGGGAHQGTVAGNQLQVSGSGGFGPVSLFQVGPDIDLSFALPVKTAGYIAIYWSLTNGTAAGWEGVYLDIDISGGQWRFRKRVAGSITTIATGTNPSGSVASGNSVRIVRTGDSLLAYRNEGVGFDLIVSGSDSASKIAGPVAIDFGSATTRLDDLADATAPPSVTASAVPGIPTIPTIPTLA